MYVGSVITGFRNASLGEARSLKAGALPSPRHLTGDSEILVISSIAFSRSEKYRPPSENVNAFDGMLTMGSTLFLLALFVAFAVYLFRFGL